MSSPRYRCTDTERLLLERYISLLYAQSNRINLTRVPQAEAWARHVEESLDLLPLRRWTSGEYVLDLGSGGGVPGLPLAITQPQLDFGLIERDRAKAAFLLSCLGQLGLASVRVMAQDASELARSQGFREADVLVSRAALPLPRLLGTAARLLRTGGEGLVHVGASAALGEPELVAAHRAGVGGLKLERAGRSRVLRFVKLPVP